MVIKNLTILDINSALIQIQKQIEVLRQENIQKQIEVLRQEIENLKAAQNG